MPHLLVRAYRAIFARKIFYNANKLLFRCSLSGLGILNYENSKVSGEDYFLSTYLKGKGAVTVLDVGANRGDYSRKVLKSNPDATVYAFEPHPQTFSRLQRDVQHPNFKAFNLAVGGHDGKSILYDYLAGEGTSHATLYPEVIRKFRSSEAEGNEVSIIRLDCFMRERNIECIALLKIDVEGNELQVISGLGNTLNRGFIKIIHFEFNEMNVYSRTFFKDFIEILPDYNLYRLLPYGMVKLEKYESLYYEIFAYQNIIAIHKECST